MIRSLYVMTMWTQREIHYKGLAAKIRFAAKLLQRNEETSNPQRSRSNKPLRRGQRKEDPVAHPTDKTPSTCALIVCFIASVTCRFVSRNFFAGIVRPSSTPCRCMLLLAIRYHNCVKRNYDRTTRRTSQKKGPCLRRMNQK